MTSKLSVVLVGAVAAFALGLVSPGDLRAAPRPVGPLPLLPSITRVSVKIEKAGLVVTHVVALPRGEWQNKDLDLFASYGGPGAPLALDARLHRVPDGALEAPPDDAGTAVTYDRAPRCPESAHPLIGKTRMAGVVLHVKEADLRASLADGLAELRVRALYPLPAEDESHGYEARVRLGVSNGVPLTLGRVQIVAPEAELRVVKVEARLCGPDAESRPLSLSTAPKPIAPASPGVGRILPALSVRHTTDDLCVRFWTDPPASPSGAKPATPAPPR